MGRLSQTLVLAALGASTATLESPALATVLFSDSLQGTLAAWTVANHDVSIVAAPGGGNAATWSQTVTGGDLYTSSFSSGTGSFTVTFDTFGNCGQTTACGVFLADTAPAVPVEGWILADENYAYAAVFDDRNGGWEQVSYTFAGSATVLDFENCCHSANAFYLRNVVLTDNSAGAAIGTLTVTDLNGVPEPSTWAMMMLGLGSLGATALLRKRKLA